MEHDAPASRLVGQRREIDPLVELGGPQLAEQTQADRRPEGAERAGSSVVAEQAESECRSA
jgi:hypothetical protein